MRLTELTLMNFINHKKSIIPINHLNVFQGQNTSGKTAIADSLRWLIAGPGRNMTKAADRQNERNLVSLGENSATVLGVFNSSNNETVKIMKTVKNDASIPKIRLKIDDKERSILQSEIYQLFNMSDKDERKITALMNADRFIELNSSDRKQFLFDLMGITLTEELLLKEFQKFEIPEDLHKVLLNTILTSKFEKAEEWAVSKRITKKRDKGNLDLTVPADFAVNYKAMKMSVSQISLKSLQEDIASLQQSVNELRVVFGKNTQIVEQNGVTEMLKKINDLGIKIIAEGQIFEKYQSSDELKKKIDELKDKYTKADVFISENNGKIQMFKKEIKDLNDRKIALEKIGDAAAACPVCGNEMTEKVIEKLKADTENDIKQLSDKVAKTNKEVEDLSAQQTKDSETLRQLESVLEQFKTAQTNIENWSAQKKQLEDERVGKKQEYDEAKRKIDQAKIDIDKNEKAIAVLTDLKLKVNTYQQQSATAQKNTELAKKLTAEIELYDRIAKLLSPKGEIINDILLMAIHPMQQHLDELNNLGLCDTIVLDKDSFLFTVGDRTEAMLDRHGSEYLRLSYIITETICFFSKFPILIFDRIDTLIEDVKLKFQDFLEYIQDQYENIFVFASKNKSGKPPDLDETQASFFWVKSGTVKKV